MRPEWRGKTVRCPSCAFPTAYNAPADQWRCEFCGPCLNGETAWRKARTRFGRLWLRGVLRMKRLLAFYLNRHRVRSYGGCPIDTRDNTPLGSEIVVVLTGRVTR